MFRQPWSGIKESFPKLAWICLVAPYLLSHVKVLQIAFSFLVDILKPNFKILSVFQLVVRILVDQDGFTLKCDGSFLIKQINTDFWVSFLDSVFYLSVTCVKLQKLKRHGFLTLTFEELLNKNDFVELSQQFMSIALQDIRFILDDRVQFF